MKIILFGGTTEGRILSHRLAECGITVTVCVATEYGREEQGTAEGITVECGRKDIDAMCRTITGADFCIDATHPYATQATENIRAACEACAVPYRRLLRPKSQLAVGDVLVKSAAQAADYLAQREGNILLTTGAKELAAYREISTVRLFPRILPMHAGLTACEELGIPRRNILAMQGPFSVELNMALLRQYQIRYLVTKDGGKTGGFEEKVLAARRTGVQLIIIVRPEERDGASLEEILQECEERQLCK